MQRQVGLWEMEWEGASNNDIYYMDGYVREARAEAYYKQIFDCITAKAGGVMHIEYSTSKNGRRKCHNDYPAKFPFHHGLSAQTPACPPHAPLRWWRAGLISGDRSLLLSVPFCPESGWYSSSNSEWLLLYTLTGFSYAMLYSPDGRVWSNFPYGIINRSFKPVFWTSASRLACLIQH